MTIAAAKPESTASFAPIHSSTCEMGSTRRGYLNGAYQLRMDDSGSVETGKHADLVVLDENPFETDRSAIHEIRPKTVLRSGDVTFGSL